MAIVFLRIEEPYFGWKRNTLQAQPQPALEMEPLDTALLSPNAIY